MQIKTVISIPITFSNSIGTYTYITQTSSELDNAILKKHFEKKDLGMLN